MLLILLRVQLWLITLVGIKFGPTLAAGFGVTVNGHSFTCSTTGEMLAKGCWVLPFKGRIREMEPICNAM